jgi:hypothetical protein
MRDCLAALFSAGVKHARFQATAAGMSRRGHVILTEVETPIGDEPYCWVLPSQSKWLPPMGETSEFIADIAPYWKEKFPSMERDFTLVNLRPVWGV